MNNTGDLLQKNNDLDAKNPGVLKVKKLKLKNHLTNEPSINDYSDRTKSPNTSSRPSTRKKFNFSSKVDAIKNI